MALSDMLPWGSDEEDEKPAPRQAILETKGESEFGMEPSTEYIRLFFHEDGTVSNREKIKPSEAFDLLDSNEAFKTTEEELDQLRKGKADLSELWMNYKKREQQDLEQKMEERYKEEMPEKKDKRGYIEKEREKSPIGGEARKRKLDEAIEDSGGY